MSMCVGCVHFTCRCGLKFVSQIRLQSASVADTGLSKCQLKLVDLAQSMFCLRYGKLTTFKLRILQQPLRRSVCQSLTGACKFHPGSSGWIIQMVLTECTPSCSTWWHAHTTTHTHTFKWCLRSEPMEGRGLCNWADVGQLMPLADRTVTVRELI